MAESTVTVPPRPALVVIPDVELLQVGVNWPLASDGTEEGTFTPEDLAAAVQAQDDPNVRSGIVKAGSGHGKLQEPPSFGRIQNLRLANDGMTLRGDLVGVPTWLAEILPYAWGSRSIEASRNKTTASGKTHPLVIDGVALLSVHLPAISSLEDVRAIYAAESMEEAGVTLTAGAKGQVYATAAEVRDSGAVPQPVKVAAALTTEDVRRAFYDNGPGHGSYWWIREMELDPAITLIVDDDNGSLWRVPVTIDGDDVTFEAPQSVRVEYVPATAASSSHPTRPAIVWANRAESRPEVPVDLTALRKRLNLGEDVTDEQVLEAAAKAIPEPAAVVTPPPGEPTTTPGATPPPGEKPADTPPPDGGTRQTPVPEGAVLVDAEEWARVKAEAGQGVQAAQTMRKRDRDNFIRAAEAKGKLRPSNEKLRASLEREWDRDPVTAQAMVDELAQVVPVTEAGHAGGEPAGDSAWDNFERQTFPDVAQVRAEPTQEGR